MELIKLTLIWIVIWTGLGLIGLSSRHLYESVKETRHDVQVVQKIDKLVDEQINKTQVHADWRVNSKVPVEITLNSLGQTLKIVPNQIINGEWQISDKYANYLIGSGVIGQGNMVIYAHKRRGMFINLSKLQIGDTITVRSPDMVGNYQVQSMMTVSPVRTDILNDNGQDVVTLYTCDGWQDEHRLVVKAKYIN